MPQANKGNYKAVETGLIFAIQDLKYVKCDMVFATRSNSWRVLEITAENVALQVCNVAR
jgi:hypothetical protein